MNQAQNWRERVEAELIQAEKARREGNEGMARVCARRAAGAIIGEYLQRIGRPQSGPSAYDRLRFFYAQEDLPAEARAVAAHFIERITPEHELPVEADLLAEARWLADALLPERG